MRTRFAACFAVAVFVLCMTAPAEAQTAAKKLFGAKQAPASLASRAIGSYARGCLAGGQQLAVDGTAWQAMRLSRNRHWGHPSLLRYLERLAADARDKDGWPGLLVGDLAQPRGGPMLSGHASHQIGLDADIWLTPMPERRLTREEREEKSAVSMIKDPFSINPDRWTDAHMRLVKRAASYPEVARIFVHPAIKKTMCEAAGGDRAWLRKVRPWWGHHYHFHVRLSCPQGSAGCTDQTPPPPGDGCGAPIEEWFAIFRRPAPPKPKVPPKPKPELTMSDLPPDCRTVLSAEAMATDGEPADAAIRADASMPSMPLPLRNPR